MIPQNTNKTAPDRKKNASKRERDKHNTPTPETRFPPKTQRVMSVKNKLAQVKIDRIYNKKYMSNQI